MFFGVAYTAIFFVLFALFLFLYHYKATGKFNVFFLVYLVALMISEVGFLYDFEAYINVIAFTYIVSQMCFLWLLKPVLKIKWRNFSTHNLTELIVGFLGVSYIIGYLLYIIFPLIPDLTLFLPSIIAYLIITTLCIGIPFFNKHPDNIILWGIGGGMVAEMTCAFIFEYVSDYRIYIVMAHIFGAFLKIIFAIYLTRILEIKNSEKEFE